MFINDVHRKEEIRNIAVQHLRKHGVKFRPKKPRPQTQVPHCGKKVFKVPLQSLETETVTLKNGQQLVIPKRIHEMCSFIMSKAQTEGIFRKEGSKARQSEIKLSLDRGCPLGNKHHVIDVAVILKCFLRELPEPLIPPAYNDLYLMCSLEKRPRDVVLECILLACLLLPSETLNVLSYLMQFFYDVASFQTCNKMCFSNLSILIGPNIFPIDDKLAPKSSFTITRICDITKLLIENSRSIGVIPDYIIDQIGQVSDVENEKRRKNKRRSGSLTRMLNGLKKIVGSKNEDDPGLPHNTDLLLTPTIHASIKKKKDEGGLSLKKKKEVLTKLPDCPVLSRTPISVNPNGNKKNGAEDKKMHWYMRSRSMKSLKEDDSLLSNVKNGPKSVLERRWSAVSNAANFRKKKVAKKEAALTNEPDYVRVSKTEYEDFKNRVSAIERRISLELDNINDIVNIGNVQTAYEKTLETGGSLSPSTDQLARRLSRDLRIRRSAEQTIIRSPSARKIGSIRRRSTEREKKGAQAVQNQSWHREKASLLPRVSAIRKKHRSKDGTDSELPHATPPTNLQRSSSDPKKSVPKPKLARVSSSPGTFSLHDSSGVSSNDWISAEGYFSVSKTSRKDLSCNARASIAKLRSQNVGMVRAKARLFDNLNDSDTSSEAKPISRSAESIRASYRIKALRGKNSNVSPRLRQANMSQKQRLQFIGRQYVRLNGNSSPIDVSQGLMDVSISPRLTPRPRNMPHVKAPLAAKTPKRLCRTPAVDKRTPFRAVATPM